jgi:hypothetical protein
MDTFTGSWSRSICHIVVRFQWQPKLYYSSRIPGTTFAVAFLHETNDHITTNIFLWIDIKTLIRYNRYILQTRLTTNACDDTGVSSTISTSDIDSVTCDNSVATLSWLCSPSGTWARWNFFARSRTVLVNFWSVFALCLSLTFWKMKQNRWKFKTCKLLEILRPRLV